MTLDEQQAICDAAMAGPWRHRIDRDWPEPDRIIENLEGFVIIRDEKCEQHFKLDRDHTNFEFIATARTEWPNLIAEHRKALAEIERLCEQVTTLTTHLVAAGEPGAATIIKQGEEIERLREAPPNPTPEKEGARG